MCNCTDITVTKSTFKTNFYSAHCRRISCLHHRPGKQVQLNTTVILPPPVNMVPPARPGTLQVFFHNNHTQDSGSHMSKMSGPPFTEDRLSTSSSSDQEMCDQEVNNITRTRTPSETSALVMSPRPGSSATVDYSTQGDPDQPAYSPLSGLACEQ